MARAAKENVLSQGLSELRKETGRAHTAVIEPARNVFLKHFDLDNACWLNRFDKWW